MALINEILKYLSHCQLKKPTPWGSYLIYNRPYSGKLPYVSDVVNTAGKRSINDGHCTLCGEDAGGNWCKDNLCSSKYENYQPIGRKEGSIIC